MMEIRTEVDIEASVDTVWEVLTDFDAFSEWNPFMREVKGRAAVGEKISVFLKPPGAIGMTVRPRLRKVETGRELRWRERMLLPGIFDGEHIFEIAATGDGCRLVHRKEFRGVLVWFTLAIVGQSTARGFLRMNEALKDRAESACPRW